MTEEAAAAIRRGTVRLSRRLRSVRPAESLSAAKIGVLGHLHRYGPSSPGQVAAADRQRPQALTRVLAELQSARLIERGPSERDGRGVTLRLTPAGSQALEQDMAARDRWLVTALGGFSETEVAVMRLAGSLMDRLADAEVEESPAVSWKEHAIWWQVYPLGFLGALHEQPGRRLPQLTDWLDYALELGVNGLALGPVFASETHGYDTLDHYRVDPRLGDEADLDGLLEAAHSRGLKVLFDGVFNHVGRNHPRVDAWARREPDGGYATFEGHPGLVALDHSKPEVAEYLVAVMKHWLDRGIDGWRLDAAYAVPKSFWAEAIPQVRKAREDAYFVAEVIHGDYAGFVAETGVDAVTQYELWKAIWSSLNDGNLFELSWALKRHSEYVAAFAPLTFVGNHDVTRIASALDDERHLPHALAVLFGVGGTPSVYSGDEQAFRGVKENRAGGDDAVRPAFPATPDGLAPFGRPTYRLHQELIGLRRRHPWLHRARTTTPTLTNTAAVLESTDGVHRLLIALNLADEPVTLEAPGATALLAGTGRLDAVLDLPPYGWAVLEAG